MNKIYNNAFFKEVNWSEGSSK